MKIIHTADWQLGKPFGRFDPDVRAALTEARFDAIDAIGRTAVEHGATHVLVAGDVFDTEGPEDRTIVQALSRMERYACRWWLLPGNHDFARNGGLWDRVRGRAGKGIVVLTDPVPQEIEPGVWLLPAPLTHRHNLDDPTDQFDGMETPGASVRIGLAHGSIRDFGSQGETKNQIAPDRARRSNLDYLALGDWHGVLRVDGRTWYAGTPETDRFQRDDPGRVLLVDLSPDAEPQVTPIRTGRFQWLVRDWTVNDGAAFHAESTRLLDAIDPPATLLQLSLAGITGLTDRIAVLGAIEDDLGHRLRYLDPRTDDLVGRPSEEDLATLAVEGMLGAAAVRLNSQIETGGPEGQLAKRALERLFVEYTREVKA
jgi:DNA repair exonuclease SbcCD nuclease subunit